MSGAVASEPMAAASKVFRRCLAVAVLGAALAACSGDDTTEVTADADADTTSSTGAPQTSEPSDTDGTAPVAPADLEFRPVLQLLPPGGVSEADGGSDGGCTTPDDAWAADQPVLAPQVENGAEVACFELGPVEVDGSAVESATAADGGGTGSWSVALELTVDGIVPFNALAGECYDGAATCPTRQLAIVVDGTVISAPSINAPTFERDQITISGAFTQKEAEALAERLV